MERVTGHSPLYTANRLHSYIRSVGMWFTYHCATTPKRRLLTAETTYLVCCVLSPAPTTARTQPTTPLLSSNLQEYVHSVLRIDVAHHNGDYPNVSKHPAIPPDLGDYRSVLHYEQTCFTSTNGATAPLLHTLGGASNYEPVRARKTCVQHGTGS